MTKSEQVLKERAEDIRRGIRHLLIDGYRVSLEYYECAPSAARPQGNGVTVTISKEVRL